MKPISIVLTALFFSFIVNLVVILHINKLEEKYNVLRGLILKNNELICENREELLYK